MSSLGSKHQSIHQRLLPRPCATHGLALAGCLLCATLAAAAPQSDWEQSPYRVHVTVAVDSAHRPWSDRAERIANGIRERVDRAIAPLWRLEVHVADSGASRRYCMDPQPLPWDALTEEQRAFDKLFWLGVQDTPSGYRITCRELDVYTRHWGAVRRRLVPQSSFLEEACFDLLTKTFSPLARVSALSENDAQVRLTFKGSGLPLQAFGRTFVTGGEVFQPLLRRTDRSGELMENGIVPVPWTYLTTATEEEGGAWLADIHSGIRRAFGIQRGRVEQLAVALRNPRGPTRVRFHARADQKLPLAGYEVFLDQATEKPRLVGMTDADGTITIPPADTPLATVLLRSEGQVLAKVPVPPGVSDVIEIPIADNTSRLRAHAEAQVIREQLVDVVARRAIMMARVRALLKSQRVEEARKLMAELDALPSSSDFARSLEALEKRIPQTEDPTIKRNIDKLFTSTRELLGKFLDRRPIIELQSQVNQAQAGGS